MNLKNRQAFVVIAFVFLVVGFLELTLSLLALASTRVDWLLTPPSTPQTVPDARLGYRPNPDYPGHDRKGFRNPKVPAKAHIVALGDSQTYGTGVRAAAAWPRQLESLTGKTVYSMAYGGYGPADSLVLWDEALALSPTVVVEAFYAGNDLFDSFDCIYNRGQLPELKSPDPQLQASVRDAEQSEPIQQRVVRMFQMGAAVDEETTTVTPDGVSLWRILSQHSKIYGLLVRAWYEATRPAKQSSEPPQDEWTKATAFAELHPAYCQIFTSGQFKTVFTSEYRLAALDLGDPRIAEGLQISLRAIQKMHELATRRGIRFLVVLIPTKEAVFRKLLQDSSVSYRALAENEERVWRITKDFLERNGIEYLDSLPVLREQLAAGIQPYRVSHDGHPNEPGHKAIAKLVAAHLESK